MTVAAEGILLSKRLGTFRPFRFMVDGIRLKKTGKVVVTPRLTPAFLMLFVPFVVLAGGIEWRFAAPWEQYLGVFPGDLALSAAIGWTILNLFYHLPLYDKRRWYQGWKWHVSSLLFGVGFACFMLYGEIMNTIHQWYPEAAYTVPQLASPSHDFHFFIVVIAGYIGMSTLWPMLFHVPRKFWKSKLIILLLIAVWIFCFAYLDNTLPRPDLNDIHPLNGGWFGPYGLKLWHILFG